MVVSIRWGAQQHTRSNIILVMRTSKKRPLLMDYHLRRLMPEPAFVFTVLGFRVQGLGFRVSGLTFKVAGMGVRVWGVGCKV